MINPCVVHCENDIQFYIVFNMFSNITLMECKYFKYPWHVNFRKRILVRKEVKSNFEIRLNRHGLLKVRINYLDAAFQFLKLLFFHNFKLK